VSVARRLGLLAWLLLAACDSAPYQSNAGPGPVAPPLMKHTVVGDGLPLSADPIAPSEDEPNAAPSRSQPPPINIIAYDRKLWQHWVDDDHDCQDTRTEVLLAESYEQVGFEDKHSCEIATGRWQCPYTGKLIREVHLLDVDHLVPLANAHRSGASGWTPARRRQYANDLDHPEHLVAVEYSANRSKGANGPEAWLPASEDYRCTYVREWVEIKQRWALTMTDAEALAVRRATQLCEAGGVPPLPQDRAKPAAKPSPAKPAAKPAVQPSSSGECCRTCNKGKACGDSCIAQTSTCSKPPGCACNG
jgi:hypothetical protein